MLRQALDLVWYQVGYYQMLEGSPLQSSYLKPVSHNIMLFGISVLVLALLMGVFMFLMRQTIVVMSRLIEYDLRKKLYAHYQVLDTTFYRQNSTGDLMARMMEDVGKVRMFVGPAILYGINLITTTSLILFSMLHVSGVLTLYSFLPLPILALAIYVISSTINKKSRLIQEQLSKLNTVAQENFTGIRVIKAFAREKSAGDFFAQETESYRSRKLSLARVDAFFSTMVRLLIGMSTILTVYVGGRLVSQGAITPGNIAEFVIYINMLSWPVIAIGWIASLSQQAAASQKRLNDFLNTQPLIDPLEGRQITQLHGDIEFKNVTFTYPNTGITALSDVSFKVRAGQKIAIVGRTGSGKTTLAELLLKMYPVTSGRVTLDGQSISDVAAQPLRALIGYVPQDVFLFSETIRDNIRFGKPDATQEDIEHFARIACIHNEILELPLGYDTLVGERGVMLSGGQKQRISIARALIKDPDVLILDDCLSAVDTRTEHAILQYTHEALRNKTVLLITHRTQGLQHFDKVLVLDQGRLVEFTDFEQRNWLDFSQNLSHSTN